jgi:hypothetical protein
MSESVKTKEEILKLIEIQSVIVLNAQREIKRLRNELDKENIIETKTRG